jgi:hypothetical protein
MLNKDFKSLLQKEMTRKDFLGFTALTVAGLFGVVGVLTELLSHAATPYASEEAEDGTLTPSAALTSDSTASGGKAVAFGAVTTTPNPATTTVVFPADAGIIDVSLHGVDKTGASDCTATLNSLIATTIGKGPYYTCCLYFPAGTYLISGSILAKDSSGIWRPNLTLRGENVNTTTIKMRDGVWTSATSFGGSYPTNSGFASNSSPNVENSMLVTGTYGATSGNNAFNNYVYDLTFDLGNNPGGGCIGYLVNNVGAIRRCNFTCTAGYLGVDLGRGITGPGLISDCNFTGPFAMPWISYGGLYSFIMERCNVTAASPGGYSGYQGFTMGIKDCNFVQPVTVLQASADTTYWNTPDIKTTNNPGGRVQYLAPGTEGFVIPSVDTPLMAYDPLSDWANVASYSSVQAAMNSGKSTIYFPANTSYPIAPGITIPDTVNRVICMGYGPSPSSWSTTTPFFETTGSSATPLTFEWGGVQASGPNGTDQNTYVYLKHSSSRELVMLDWSGFGIIQGTPGCGTIFGDNFFMHVDLVSGNKLYARQWNWEDPFVTALNNNGGQAWIFGLKTEWGCQGATTQADFQACYARFQPTINTTGGGRTDMLVGFSLPNSGSQPGWAQYQFADSSYAISSIDFQYSGITGMWTVDVGGSGPLGTVTRVANPGTAGFRLNAAYSYNGG